MDGEERSIPVFRQGVLETKGFFVPLLKDTSFTIEADSLSAPLKLYAAASPLPVLLNEIERLGSYEYLCNEQLASKLKALLLKKKIYGYLHKDFKEEKNINKIISRLNKSKVLNGMWGWWTNSTPALWISLHVMEALLMAGKEGYPVYLDKQLATDYLLFNLESYRGVESTLCLDLLFELGAKVNFKKYTDSLEKQTHAESLYEQLRLLELKQKTGSRISLDTLVSRQRHTMMGNIYWGEENFRLFDNSIQNTLLMYRLLRNAGGYKEILQKVLNYFLEQRKDGQWRNTYESSLMLETILPDLLKTDEVNQPAKLVINGVATVLSIPYSATIPAGRVISVSKQGSQPVYFTAYRQSWNARPQKVAGDFIVNSSFEKNNEPVTRLTAGEPVNMKVRVQVKADADYVMIEIPVPAGCSYKSREQYYYNNEVHREYLKNKVSIFISTLKKGEYSFNISLLPRYTGNYHLNPARAEMMYFPVFYGQEELKKIEIQ